MTERQRIPADLAEIPPGPELAGVLASIDLTRLSGFDCVEVLKARYRLVNHDRAQLMASMVEVGLCDIDPDDEVARRAGPDEFAADEVRAALVWTRRAAETQFCLAYDLHTRLPAVPAAMDAGGLDEPRARILSEWTADLSDPQARAVCDRLLPRVGQLTTGQLIEAIKKLAIAVDPEWARRRYEHAVADRKVAGFRNPDGSANLSGLNLPVDRVAGATARIEALAKAAKRAGHPAPVDHLRADLYLGMLDGSYTNLDDNAIIELLLANEPGSESANELANEPGSESANEPADESVKEPANESAAKPQHDDFADRDPDSDDFADGDPDGDDGDGGGDPASASVASDGEPFRGGVPEAAQPASRPTYSGGKELRVRLSTLLGRDQHPGELAGWGPIHADLARDLARTMLGAQWRYVVTGTDGRLEYTGLVRARPTRARRSRSGDTVELQVPAALLAELTSGGAQASAWSWVLTDLIRQHTDPRIEPGRLADDARRRTPGAALRRHVQIRDRCCVGPGCRSPARAGDVDHTLDHAHGGRTLERNLDDTCRHDHRLKHEGGWELHQPEPGWFRWISRLGHPYPVRPPPIIEPLPDPIPGDRPAAPHHPEPADHDDPILPPPERPPPSPPVPGPHDDPPF